MINPIPNDLKWRRTIGGFDREASRIHCDRRRKTFAARQGSTQIAAAAEQGEPHRSPGEADVGNTLLIDVRKGSEVICPLHRVTHTAREVHSVLRLVAYSFDATLT